jgi:saccharopine dehydrogenase-like NADP-dependent oxidoreductase
MTKILVLGVGKIGTALIKDLSNSKEVTEIVAADVDVELVERKLEPLNSPKIKAEQLDAKDMARLNKVLSGGFDVVVSTVLPELHYNITKAAF